MSEMHNNMLFTHDEIAFWHCENHSLKNKPQLSETKMKNVT